MSAIDAAVYQAQALLMFDQVKIVGHINGHAPIFSPGQRILALQMHHRNHTDIKLHIHFLHVVFIVTTCNTDFRDHSIIAVG